MPRGKRRPTAKPFSPTDFIDTNIKQLGQSPIRLSRLQSALLGEAFRLVEDNVVSAEDVDKAVADGLGLRRFFMGPFETIDHNAANGIREYCKNLGPMYYGLAKEQADPREWSDELVRRIEAERRQTLPVNRLPDRRAWRDDRLAAFAQMKSKLMADK